MPEAWQTFYLMVGSSAAALIGLLFVVITLTGDIDAARAQGAQSTFLTPTVLHFAVVFVISSAAVAPELSPPAMGLAIAVPSALGLIYGVGAVIRLATARTIAPHWTDYAYYGVLPSLSYFWLLMNGWAIWQQTSYADTSMALAVLALLLLAIRDAWDLATWLVYHKQG